MYNKDKIINIFHSIVAEAKPIQPYVIVAQPRRDLREVPAQDFNTATNLHIDMNGYSHSLISIGGELIDVARNYLIEAALDSKAKYILFIGEDTVMPYDGFRILHETAEKNPDAMVAGVYYLKLSSPMVSIYKNDYIRPANVDPGQVFEAWQTGMDALLIPIQLLRDMKEKDPDLPFCCIAAPNTFEGVPFIGEDNFFVHRWRKMGYKLLVNTDVQCLHCDLKTGKYSAHPSVRLNKYFTNFAMTGPLVWEDKKELDMRWTARLPKNPRDKGHALVEKYCTGRGIELNVIPYNTYKLRNCTGFEYVEGKKIAAEDNSQDFVIISQMVTIVHDLIGSFLEWSKVVKDNGTIFMTFSAKTMPATSSMGDSKSITIENFEEKHKTPKKENNSNNPTQEIDLKTIVNLIEYCNKNYNLNWSPIEIVEGNGHGSIVICKKIKSDI